MITVFIEPFDKDSDLFLYVKQLYFPSFHSKHSKVRDFYNQQYIKTTGTC